MKCSYKWDYRRGKCEEESLENEDFCFKHIKKVCSCGKKAIRDCSSSVSLCCGAPTCLDQWCHYHNGEK